MSLERGRRINSFKDVEDLYQMILDRLSWSDLTVVDLRTAAPTASTLDKGKAVIAEVSGTPTLYYNTTAGVLYKWDGVVV